MASDRGRLRFTEWAALGLAGGFVIAGGVFLATQQSPRRVETYVPPSTTTTAFVLPIEPSATTIGTLVPAQVSASPPITRAQRTQVATPIRSAPNDSTTPAPQPTTAPTSPPATSPPTTRPRPATTQPTSPPTTQQAPPSTQPVAQTWCTVDGERKNYQPHYWVTSNMPFHKVVIRAGSGNEGDFVTNAQGSGELYPGMTHVDRPGTYFVIADFYYNNRFVQQCTADVEMA